MLVLTRKVGERVVIDGGIVVTVVLVKRNQVRLAFEAPPDVGVLREEICPRPGSCIPGGVGVSPR